VGSIYTLARDHSETVVEILGEQIAGPVRNREAPVIEPQIA
jgi:hypothetical protein